MLDERAAKLRLLKELFGVSLRNPTTRSTAGSTPGSPLSSLVLISVSLLTYLVDEVGGIFFIFFQYRGFCGEIDQRSGARIRLGPRPGAPWFALGRCELTATQQPLLRTETAQTPATPNLHHRQARLSRAPQKTTMHET